MKIEMYKCGVCNKLFEKEADYEEHKTKEKMKKLFLNLFPVEDITSDNFIQRDKLWYEIYQHTLNPMIILLEDYIIKNKLNPFEYLGYRYLSEKKSIFAELVFRYYSICPKCYKEYNQPYNATHCKCNFEKKENE